MSFSFPIYIGFRQVLLSSNDFLSIGLSITAILIAILALIAQIYYYALYAYGNSDALDVIGMGVPVSVKLAGEEKHVTLLSHMGIPTIQPDLTDSLQLIDETDTHYIVGIAASQTPPPTSANRKMSVFKIDKNLISGIVYL